MFTAYHTFSLDLNQQVLTLLLNESRHTSLEHLQEFERLFHEVELASDVRSLVISGRENLFLGGISPHSLQKLDSVGAQTFIEYVHQVLHQIETCSKPVIAAVNGAATGFGMELVLASHIALAAKHASFSLNELSMGHLPLGGAIPRLSRQLGAKRAIEIALAGYSLTAEDAYDWGLINHVFGNEDLLAKAHEMARLFNSNAPLAVRQALLSCKHSQDMPLAQSLNMDQHLNAFCWNTADLHEGIQAHLEQRPPIFRAR